MVLKAEHGNLIVHYCGVCSGARSAAVYQPRLGKYNSTPDGRLKFQKKEIQIKTHLLGTRAPSFLNIFESFLGHQASLEEAQFPESPIADLPRIFPSVSYNHQLMRR